jgi:hypothetical protein
MSCLMQKKATQQGGSGDGAGAPVMQDKGPVVLQGVIEHGVEPGGGDGIHKTPEAHIAARHPQRQGRQQRQTGAKCGSIWNLPGDGGLGSLAASRLTVAKGGKMNGLNYLSEREWVVFTIEEELGNLERLTAPMSAASSGASVIPPS